MMVRHIHTALGLLAAGIVFPLTIGHALQKPESPKITRVSVSSKGVEADYDSKNASVSADGRFVAFESKASNLVPGDTNGATDVFGHDLSQGTTWRISVDSSGNQGDGNSRRPKVSADGSGVMFSSSATNLVSGDTNGVNDMFLRDTISGTTTRADDPAPSAM